MNIGFVHRYMVRFFESHNIQQSRLNIMPLKQDTYNYKDIFDFLELFPGRGLQGRQGSFSCFG